MSARVWIGCLACYNGGTLRGEWVDGTEAASFVPCEGRGHEEWWVMDHEGYEGFLNGECSPVEAQRLAEAIDAIDDAGVSVAAVAAWADNRGEKVEEWDRPTREAFEESFDGEWPSEKAFAEERFGEIYEVPEEIESYIDYEKVARDFFMGDNWSAENPSGGVFVFRRN